MNFREFKELVRTGNLQQVRDTIEATPDLLRTRDPDGDQWDEKTALHCAARYAHLEIVKFLVERGANVNSLNRKENSAYFGITPLLMNALMQDDCAQVTKLLLDAGGDTSITYQGKTIAEIAEEKGNAGILAVLREAPG